MTYPTIGIDPYSSDRQYGSQAQARRAAQQLYESAYARGWLRRIWARLTHHSTHLHCLLDVENLAVHGSYFAGVQTVPVDQIRGSQGRCNDFDSAFSPLKDYNQERWVSVAAAYHTGAALPLVKLVQVGQEYFVQDGHHRVSVARAIGQQEIEAELTVWEVTEAVPVSRADEGPFS